MKKKFVLFCILTLLVFVWIMKSCDARIVKQPQQTHADEANRAIHTEAVPQVETTNAIAEQGPAAERSIFPPQWKLSSEVEHAMTKGARARATLRVVDSTGKCVPNARVRLNFMFFERKNNFETGMTDTNGVFSAERDTMSECNWFIEKDGYYDTEGMHSFVANLTNDSVKDGRWQPWNPTLEVVLKEKRKPIPMYTKHIESKMPAQDVSIGYDFLKGDWVDPYGEGKSADITLTYSETPRTNTWRRYDFVIAFSNKLDGAYLRKKDTYSQFVSAHEADTKDYQSVLAFVYERTDAKIIQDKRISEDDILVFRVRSKTDENGNISEAYYGKIYGPCKFADGPQRFIRISYYFNPTPNDRNLEFDGKNNLFNPDWKDSWPRNP